MLHERTVMKGREMHPLLLDCSIPYPEGFMMIHWTLGLSSTVRLWTFKFCIVAGTVELFGKLHFGLCSLNLVVQLGEKACASGNMVKTLPEF